MTCRELTDSLLDYRCGTLPRIVREAFEAHVAACDGCATYARSYDVAMRLLQTTFRLAETGIPESLTQRILAASPSGGDAV